MQLDADQKLFIYAVGALDEPLRSKIKLQKLFFLVSNAFEDIDNLFKFEPHLFGPYSESLEDLSNEILKLGLIDKKGSSFILSNKGKSEYNNIHPKSELKNIIEEFKEFLNDLPDDEVMTFIYACYPDYISESIKWDKLKQNRIGVALDLLKNNKISFSRAAEVSGKDFAEFKNIAKENEIRWRK